MSAVPTSNARVALVVALGLVLTSRVASAQQMDPNMQMSMPTPAKKSAPKPARAKKPAASKHEPHAVPMDDSTMGGMNMGAMPDMAPMDHSTMDHSSTDRTSTDHASMEHGVDGTTVLRTPIPVLTDTDRAAAKPPEHDHPVHDNGVQSYTLFDRLESSNGGNAVEWNGRAWIGSDMNRLWLRTEGSRIDGRTGSGDLEVLAGHSVSPWWDVVAGIRHDFRPGPVQDFAAIGVQGVAPYKIALDATAYVGQGGQTAVRIDFEYETLLTNRLILQPQLELNAYGQDDPGRGIGSGLSTLDAGLRLRYEITRRFAPYVGVVHERAFGATARLRHGQGDDSRDTRIVAGVRWWF